MLNSAFEEVIAAQGSVQVRGRPVVREKAETLLDASREYVQFALEGQADASADLDDYIAPLQNARDDYLKAIRSEEMKRAHRKWV